MLRRRDEPDLRVRLEGTLVPNCIPLRETSSVLRLGGALSAVLAACLIATGCAIRIDDSPGDDGGAPSQVESRSGDDRCEQVDRLPASDKQAAAEAAEAALAKEGKSLAEAWDDPATFKLFQETAYESAGCDLAAHMESDAGRLQQGLHVDAGPDYYCGPGHGADKLFVPAVSSCLNDLCRKHDACYAQCSAPTEGACKWGGPTSYCDDPFMAELATCKDDSNQFGSFLVRFMATALYASNLGAGGCPVGMTCPGKGPCRSDRESDECSYCLDKLDIAGVCFERSCSEDSDEVACYTANCPAIGGCFGGYNLPAPSETESPATVEPDSLWAISVLQAVVPSTKPTGETWDADAGGFASPDVVIGVRVGNADSPPSSTTKVQDSLVPMWVDAEPLLTATAADFQASIEFTAVDVDIAFDDPIGRCTTNVKIDDFTGDPIPFVCANDLGVMFTVYFALTPPS